MPVCRMMTTIPNCLAQLLIARARGLVSLVVCHNSGQSRMLFQPPSRGGPCKGPLVFYASAPPYQPQQSLPSQPSQPSQSQVRQGLRLLRTAPSPPVLTRYSTVGSGTSKGIEMEGPVPGLSQFLQALGLEAYALSAKRWAQEQGACSLSELVENADDLATALGLSPSQRAQLQRGGPIAARQIESEHHGHGPPTASFATKRLGKAVSVPVTIPAVQVSAPVFRVLHGQRTVSTGIGRTETDIWDEREASAHGNVPAFADVTEPEVQRKDDLRPRWCTPPKERWRVDDALLRQRIPSQAEVKVKALAVAAAEADAQEEWEQDEGEGEAEASKKRPSKRAAKPDRFEAMREQFLEVHGPVLQQELGKGYKLVPADVAPAVKQKFLQECETHGSPDFGYHGTRAANIPSILQQGLRVPSNESGVRVANGSAHGVGIYTAMPGNSWLSRGFADTKDMLVCGVVDPDAEVRPHPATVATWAAPPRQVGGHRNHHKPVAPQVANLVPPPNHMLWTHRENDGIRVVGGARVIFKEERVVAWLQAKAKWEAILGRAQPYRLDRLCIIEHESFQPCSQRLRCSWPNPLIRTRPSQDQRREMTKRQAVEDARGRSISRSLAKWSGTAGRK